MAIVILGRGGLKVVLCRQQGAAPAGGDRHSGAEWVERSTVVGAVPSNGRLKEAEVCKHLRECLSQSYQQGVINVKEQTANSSNHSWHLDTVSPD